MYKSHGTYFLFTDNYDNSADCVGLSCESYDRVLDTVAIDQEK